MILKIAVKSIRNRYFTSILTLTSIALGVALFIGIERIRLGVRESFSGAISQTDLIVGARGGSLPLLLYSVFHIGNATNNISYSTYMSLKNHPAVKWTIPYSMGDSHRGYRVIATDESFYKYYRFHGHKSLELSAGRPAEDIFEVTLGSDIAKNLNYNVGTKIVLTHGISDGESIFEHTDKPFIVVGILKKTATPIDRSIYITLEGMESIHMDWADGVPPLDGQKITAETLKKEEMKVTQITSFLLGAKSRVDALRLQREILDYQKEAIMGIIPGVALAELWNGIGYAEEALRAVSIVVVIVGLLGLLVSLLTALNERRREMAILRVLGAGARRIISLLIIETSLLTSAGIVLGLLFVYGSLYLGQGWIEQLFGFTIPVQSLNASDYIYMLSLLALSVMIGFVPAIKAYKNSVADGLSLRI